MPYSRDNVIAAVRASFPEARWPEVLQLLDSYGVQPYEREKERVQLAIVKLSLGIEEKLGEYLAAAKQDYRDVLLWADEPDQAKLDTPEKKKAVFDLFRKLGLDPPPDL